MKKSNLIGRRLKITKFGVFYIWEPRVKLHLKDYGLQYKSIICIQTIIPWYEYNVYIAVRPNITDTFTKTHIANSIKVVKIVVNFDEKLKHIETSLNILLTANYRGHFDFIHKIPASELIFDARSRISV
jgi:hypothetical protein